MRRGLGLGVVLFVVGTLVVPATSASSSSASAPTCDAGVPGGQVTGTGAVARTVLTRATLTTPNASPALVSNDAFALPAGAAAPTHEFDGTLTLEDTRTMGSFQVTYDGDDNGILPGIGHLPRTMQLRFVQDCSYLIPVVRGLQYTHDFNWNLIVSPGRVWDEQGDGGWTRASFPFTLVERDANCVHNGVTTFLFSDDQVSQVRYEIAKETCELFQFDMWGQLSATYAHGTVGAAQQAALRSAFITELDDRMPEKPIADLSTDYPSSGIDTTGLAGGVPTNNQTTYGMYYNGVDYVAPCPTREGAYPYCDEMILPSYSLAKSILPGMSMMELSEEYPGFSHDLVEDSLPIMALDLGDWSGVTFQNMADMATGNYDSSAFEADENGLIMTAWLNVGSYGVKVALALSFPHRAAPGTVWVYHTSDAFLLALAEERFLDARTHTTTDIWQHLVDTILAPIHVGPDSLQILRTDNDPSGVPLGGLGLFLTQDAIAKISQFMDQDGGRIDGRQILDPSLLASALQRDGGNQGLETSPGNPGARYHDNLWASRFDEPGCSFWVPYMSGYGGITVAMMPNGATYYQVDDNGDFNWAQAVPQASKLAPQCPAG